MKIIKQLFWIFLFSLLGEMIAILLSPFLAIPGSVVGMLLLFMAFRSDWLAIEQVDEVGTWLTNNMGILFVPAGVGLIANFDIIAGAWWQLLLVAVISTALMMGFVGKLVQYLIIKREAKELKARGESID